MALLDLTSPQASILAKVLNGTLAGPDGRTGPDWRTASPELAAVAHALDRLSFATRACLVCGATFEAKNPRRTTCSDRCRQALSRSKRAAPAQAPSDGHAPAVTPIPDPVAPAPPPPATDPAPPSQPDRDRKDPAAALRDFLEEQRERLAPEWELCKADAAALGIKGIKGDHVRRFKARHKLPKDQPLSPEAQDLFRRERDTDAATRRGRDRDAADRLQRLQGVATAERLAAIAQTIAADRSPILIFGEQAGEYFSLSKNNLDRFLFSGLEPIGIKPRQKASEKLWQELANALPNADHGNRDPLYWGIAIRLADLPGEPPADKVQLLQWAHYQVGKQGMGAAMAGGFADTIRGHMPPSEAAEILGLPIYGLTRKGVNDAYRALARKHHPDVGGTAEQMHRLTEARDRLLFNLSQ